MFYTTSNSTRQSYGSSWKHIIIILIITELAKLNEKKKQQQKKKTVQPAIEKKTNRQGLVSQVDREVQVIHLSHLDLKIQAKQVFKLRCIYEETDPDLAAQRFCSTNKPSTMRLHNCSLKGLFQATCYLFKKLEPFSQLLNSKNNGPGLLIKTIFRH